MVGLTAANVLMGRLCPLADNRPRRVRAVHDRVRVLAREISEDETEDVVLFEQPLARRAAR